MPKNTSPLQRSKPTWLCRLVIVIGALLLLAACGGSTPSTGSATTTIANTPTAVTSNTTPTPTPTVAQSAPAKGSPQIVLIITNSDGSYSFSPAMLTITVGTTVIWKNVSSVPHTVSTDDGQTADSATIPVSGTFRFTFMTSGTFSYHCNYHPYMRATIVVK